ncbi:MAG: lamin tail domain-containing protein, partial [Methanobacteriota archaeon]
GLEVIHATADDFDQYRTQKFIVILGGPDAPEGVGDIVRDSGILKIDNVDYIREKGHRARYDGTNPWGLLPGQRVWILAGSDRNLTREAHLTYGGAVAEEVLALAAPPAEHPSEPEPVDPCPMDEKNPLNHTLGFESAEARGDVYICQVVYSEGSENWQIKLYNQGEEDINLKRYKITGTGDRYYRFNAYVETNIIKAGGYYTLYAAEISTSTLRLPPARGYLTLSDPSDNVIDKVEWDLLS